MELALVKHELRRHLERAGLVELIGADRMYPTLPTAVEAFRAEHGGPEAR